MLEFLATGIYRFVMILPSILFWGGLITGLWFGYKQAKISEFGAILTSLISLAYGGIFMILAPFLGGFLISIPLMWIMDMLLYFG